MVRKTDAVNLRSNYAKNISDLQFLTQNKINFSDCKLFGDKFAYLSSTVDLRQFRCL